MNKSGFYTSQVGDSRAVTFDLVARRDDLLLVIKVLSNVDSLGKESARELLKVASLLNAAPMVVGNRNCAGPIQTGILYLRHAVPIMSLDTLEEYLIEGVPPLVYAAPGGFYVQVDGSKLQTLRESKGYSLGQLADIAGVSRKAIQMYEEGMSAIVDVALRLEEFLDQPIVLPLDPFSHSKDLDKIRETMETLEDCGDEVFNQLSNLGYRIYPTSKCPFDAVSEHRKDVIITGVDALNMAIRARARSMNTLSRITERHSVLFVDDSKRDNIEGTPLIRRDELKRIDDHQDVLDLIEERRRSDKR